MQHTAWQWLWAALFVVRLSRAVAEPDDCSVFFPWCDFTASQIDFAGLADTLSLTQDRIEEIIRSSDDRFCTTQSLTEYICTEVALSLPSSSCVWPSFTDGRGSRGVISPGANADLSSSSFFSDMRFLTPETCSSQGFLGGLDPDVVFLYPVYTLPEMVELGVDVLQHPQHAFLLQVTEMESERFVAELLKLARGQQNVCVVQYGAVVYTTASQEMIHWPAMEWLLQMGNWHHYILMCAQSLPLMNVRRLRGILSSNRNTSFLRHTRGEAAESRSNIRRAGQATLPFCSQKPLRNLTMHRDNGMTDIVKSYWQKVGSWPVKVLHRGFVEYIMKSPEAFKMFHFFKYTYISNEHLLPVLFRFGGNQTWNSISDTWSSTLALWPKLTMRNTVLTMEHRHLWERKHILFGRKFNPKVDRAVIYDLIQGHSPYLTLPWLKGKKEGFL